MSADSAEKIADEMHADAIRHMDARLASYAERVRALPSAELERDAADAARYRWIRKRMDLIGTDDFREFDKGIDIAMHNDARASEAPR